VTFRAFISSGLAVVFGVGGFLIGLYLLLAISVLNFAFPSHEDL
jgi:hypothetical protein